MSHTSSSAAHPITTERIGEPSRTDWNDYVNGSAAASVYHLFEWKNVIASVFGHEGHYFAARNASGRICGVLPSIRLKSALFGDFLVSMPYFNYGGVVADDEPSSASLLQAAAQHAESIGVSHLELRHDAPIATEWPVRTDKVGMYLQLPDSAEALSKKLGAKLRSQVKRPVREGAVCVSGGAELLDEFYSVFSRNMRDLGTPVYPRAFFAAILGMSLRTQLFVVRLRGAPVAAAFLIGHRNRLEIPWASSLREANAVGVNMLLYWNVLEYACQSRYEIFDFGRSTVDAGTYKFKRQWGGEPHQLYWHYWMRGGGAAPPMLNPANPKYRLAVAAWQRLPLAIANRLGPLIVKNLP